LLFCSAGTLIQRYGTRRVSRIRGAVQASPAAGTLFLLGALAIGGSPPFAPFRSELAILAGVFDGRAYVVAAVVLACLAAIFAGLLYHAMHVALGQAPKRLRDSVGAGPLGETAAVAARSPAPDAHHRPGERSWPLLAAFALVLMLGLWVPPVVRDAAGAAAAVLPVRPGTPVAIQAAGGSR
jgi:hydrogenase-4 component F